MKDVDRERGIEKRQTGNIIWTVNIISPPRAGRNAEEGIENKAGCGKKGTLDIKVQKL